MSTLAERAQAIRLLILDVDGVLTSGTIFFDNAGLEVKGFHVLDGVGIKLLQQGGMIVALLSGKTSNAVVQRAKELGISHVFLGHDNKLPIYQKLKQQLELTDQQIAYMGDDLPDLPMMRSVGLAITVPHAPDIIQEHAHLTTKREAGFGAVREACEFILKAQDKYLSLVESFTKM